MEISKPVILITFIFSHILGKVFLVKSGAAGAGNAKLQLDPNSLPG